MSNITQIVLFLVAATYVAGAVFTAATLIPDYFKQGSESAWLWKRDRVAEATAVFLTITLWFIALFLKDTDGRLNR